MDLSKYFFPIYSGGTIVAQGFVADGYFITAAHVVKDFTSCFVVINGIKREFAKEVPVFMGEGDIYKDAKAIDLVLYKCDGVESDLFFSYYIPYINDTLENYCFHEVMNFSSLNPTIELS